MMDETLLRCPFCGGEAKFEIYGGVCSIVCQTCQCGTPVVRFGDGMSIIERWNRRAERTCHRVPGRMKYGRRMPKCSKCGQSLGDERWSYCPNCGARVVEEDA